MATVVLSALAEVDSDRLLADLARDAGLLVASRYATHFEALYDRLEAHPDIGPARPWLGTLVRIGVVPPYVVVYEHDPMAKLVTILRIVHGKRQITARLLRKE